MPLPHITAPDLRRALEDIISASTSLEDLRDARRAATVLSPEDCKRALLDALQNRALARREPRPQWCPVCKRDHVGVGEQTDAGLITRACPNVPTDDPRYYGSPVYTGDR